MSTERRYDPKSVEPKWQALWERERTWEVSNDDTGGDPFYVLEMLPYPVGRPAHGSSQELCGRGCGRAFPAPRRAAGAPSHRLRRLRPAGGEQRDQERAAPARVDRAVDRGLPPRVPLVGRVVRLVARARVQRAELLPLDAVDLPQAVRARARLPRRGGGQLVPGRRHRARQRAGHRRPLRALRLAGRGAPARAVVLPHHRLRRPPARRPRGRRVALARGHHAAQLDRALRGRRGPVQRARDGRRLPRLHHAAGHAVRRDLLRHGARAPRRAAARRGHRARGGGPRLRQPRADRVPRGPRRRRAREDRRAARPLGGQPRQRRAHPDVGRRLRADGVRHRRDHGGAGARRARPRVRREVRPADQARDRGRRRRAALHRRRRARELRSRASTGCRTARRSSRSSTGSTTRAAATARSTTACATGCSPASATGAARSRSSTARRAGSCPCRSTSCRSSCPTSATTRRRAARRWPRRRTG